ncbi:MAG TPA: glycosyltransferase family 39 protein [Bryobacteraceae bacterium]|nr:glycosyltransferase family 39 protein [Bryobacteraceae bacterium]
MMSSVSGTLNSRRQSFEKSESRRLVNLVTAEWIVLGLCVCLIWGPRLRRSFWVDEAGTWWMAHDGPLAALQKTLHWPGQSLLYSIIASFFCLPAGPLREFALRVPSLIGMAIAAYFLYRMAEEAIGRGSGFIALAMFAFNPVCYRLGTEARPYALALAATAASSWLLYKWVQTRSRRDLIWYVIASTLIVYFQYLFAAIFVVQVVYLLWVFVFERNYAKWQEIVGAFILMGVLILPLLPHLKLLLEQGRTLPFRSALPDPMELMTFVLPTVVAFGMFVGALFVQFLFPTGEHGSGLSRSTVLFFSTWLLLVPTLFLALTVKSKTDIFVDRYMSFSLEADALLLAAAGYVFFGTSRARLWALCAILLSTASPIAMRRAWGIGYDDLKPFMQIIQSESQTNPLPPVFFRSELPESNFNNWRDGLQGESRLYAPFMVYPMPNRLLPLPFHFTRDAKRFISDKLDSELRNVPEVIFVTHDDSWDSWMIGRMAQSGFTLFRQEKPNLFSVLIFKKSNLVKNATGPSNSFSERSVEDADQVVDNVNRSVKR